MISARPIPTTKDVDRMLLSRLLAATMVAGSAQPQASAGSDASDPQSAPAGRKDIPTQLATSVAR
jgi:hypothetical protein